MNKGVNIGINNNNNNSIIKLLSEVSLRVKHTVLLPQIYSVENILSQ